MRKIWNRTTPFVIACVLLLFCIVIGFVYNYYWKNENTLNPDVVFLHPGIHIKNNDYGVGIYTSVDIPANTVIMEERVNVLQNELDDHTENRIRLVKKLLNEKRSGFLNLTPEKLDHTTTAYNYQDEELQRLHAKYLPEIDADTLILYLHKLSRNVFSYKDSSVAITFYETKVNHSCYPNVTYYYCESRDDMLIFETTKDIRVGEELFISYLSLNDGSSREERREHLKYNYGFDCNCKRCRNGQ